MKRLKKNSATDAAAYSPFFPRLYSQCLRAACSDPVRMSTRRKVEVFNDTPLPDTPLIFSIQTLPFLYIQKPHITHPLPYPHLHSCLHISALLYIFISPFFFKHFPPPDSLCTSSFWLFVVTFSITFSSSSSWEVAQNPFKCCKSKSIYHNHLSLTVHIPYAILKYTLTHTNTQTAEK